MLSRGKLLVSLVTPKVSKDEGTSSEERQKLLGNFNLTDNNGL